MTITSLIFCCAVTLISSGIVVGVYYAGRSDQKEGEKPHPVILSIVFIALFGIISFGTSYFIIGSAMGKGMLYRLNQPIVSSEQLYGYQVVGKKIEENESSQIHLIDIKSLLGEINIAAPSIFKNMETSKEFFQELEIGQCFPSELAVDPNAVTAKN